MPNGLDRFTRHKGRANRQPALQPLQRFPTRPPMRILLTNDDGVHAAGLKLLERIASQFSDDVWIVAPGDRPVRRRAFVLAVEPAAAAARSRRNISPCRARRPIAC